MRAWRWNVVVGLLVLICATNCGRKSSIRPPEDTAPGAVRFLTGAGQTEGMLLTWVAPEEVASGGSIKSQDLEKFIVKRSDFVPGRSPRFETIAVVAVRELKGTGGEVVGGGKPVKGGLQFSYKDMSAEPGKRYEYEVLGVNLRGVEGVADRFLRVTFSGESTVVEVINPAKPEK